MKFSRESIGKVLTYPNFRVVVMPSRNKDVIIALLLKHNDNNTKKCVKCIKIENI